MRTIALLAAALVFAICPPALAQGKADYSGVWRKNCEDPFGLQIKRQGNGLYSVVFCKTDSCSEPGAYRPNTRIDGDPMYEVQNPNRIKVRHTEGGYSLYVRCGALSGTP